MELSQVFVRKSLLDARDNKTYLALNFLRREGQWRMSAPFNGAVCKVELLEASNGPNKSGMKVPSELPTVRTQRSGRQSGFVRVCLGSPEDCGDLLLRNAL